MTKGNLFVISGPSGAGKGTLVARLLEEIDMWLSVSATTRSPRVGETDGKDYYFLTKEAFENGIAEDQFLEWAKYNENYYGTPRKNIEQLVETGTQVLLEIETQGSLQVKHKFPDARLLFIEPPNLEILKQRLIGRGTDSIETIEKRLDIAKKELELKPFYDRCFVNDDINQLVAEVKEYILSINC